MSKVGDNWKRRERQLMQFLNRLPKGMYDEFKQQTPIRTGNARSKTRLQGNEIRADYPYAQRLEKDRVSSQAPEGMSEPTFRWVRSEVRKL